MYRLVQGRLSSIGLVTEANQPHISLYVKDLARGAAEGGRGRGGLLGAGACGREGEMGRGEMGRRETNLRMSPSILYIQTMS